MLCVGVIWIQLTLDRVHWPSFVRKKIKCKVPQKEENVTLTLMTKPFKGNPSLYDQISVKYTRK